MTAVSRARAPGIFGLASALLASLLLGACSNGRGSLDESGEQEAPAKVRIGGTVAGLAGSGLVLQNNGADNLDVSANGGFTFATAVDPGTAYSVSVLQQPAAPAQLCTVLNAAGTATQTVTDVVVNCSTGTFRIGGSVAGLQGSGLILRNNGGDDLPIASNGSFTFETELASGSAYEVTIAKQPGNPAQSCTLADAAGTVSGADVRSVRVTCSINTYSVGGSVSGVEGKGLVLQNNCGDDIGVETSGGFTFPTALASGAAYRVTVKTQPADPAQACTVQNGSGTVGSANVIDVSITCATRQFTVGGTVTGLSGAGLVLTNNGGDSLGVTANGSFTFPTAVLSGRPYQVSVAAQPSQPRQDCSVTNPSGTVSTANVTNVVVRCVTVGFSIGGSVSGLAGSGLVLRNSNGDALPIAANGSFTLPQTLPEGSPYEISVATQPSAPTQVCSVANGTGTVGVENVTNISVSCITSTFSIGGTVSGLRGFGLSVRLNEVETRPVSSNGAFAFSTRIASGASYSVTIASNPFFPAQVCSVASGSGVVGAEDVTGVRVSCAP